MKKERNLQSCTRFDFLSKEELLQVCRNKNQTINDLQSRVFLLNKGMDRMRRRGENWKEMVAEFAKNGRVGVIAVNLVKAYKEGKLKEKDAFLSMLAVTAKNLNRKSNLVTDLGII